MSFSFTQFVNAADDRTKLEAELVNPSTGKDDGKAKFEQRDDRTTFSVEIEGQESNSLFEIRVDDFALDTFSTDDSGFADLNLDSRDGDFIPSITSESWVQVIDSNGKIVLSGKLIGTENTRDSNPQTPTGDNPPVSTTNVIIPFGAKDKDVSEFYVPISISVSLSETVTWANEDDADHTVTSTAGVFNSGVFGPGQSFSYQFMENGTYQYFCQLHPWMTGTVIAGEGGDAPTPPEPTPPPSDPPLPPDEPVPPGSSQFNIDIPLGSAEQTISEFYLPHSISVSVSDSVVWKNSDIGFHTVTSGKSSPDGMFDSGLFGPEKTFVHQFTSIGTFEYFCTVHPWMTGTVIAGEGGDAPATPEPTPPPSDPPSPPGEPTETQNQNDSSQLIVSPLKQMQNGILPKDIQCKEGFSLILRISNDVGACVHPSSLPIIVQRGWGA